MFYYYPCFVDLPTYIAGIKKVAVACNSCPVSRLDDVVAEAESGAGDASELLTKMDKERKKRRQSGGRGGGGTTKKKGKGMFGRKGSGGGDGGDGEDLGGLEVFLSGLEEAAGGVREAIVSSIVHPLQVGE